jgi:glycosyltransferase involved in cell wall biosynthesis
MTAGNKKLDILVCYEKGCGGETIATENIISEFKKKRDIKVVSFASSRLIRTDSLGFFFWMFSSITNWFGLILRQKSVNWVYTTTYTAGVAAVLLKPFLNYKICFHYHGSRVPPKKIMAPLFRQITQVTKYYTSYLLHNFFLGKTDLILVPSVFSRDVLKKQFGLRGRRVVCIPSGVDLGSFKPVGPDKKRELRPKYGIARDNKVISFIGRVDKVKRIDLLLKVFALILKSRPTTSLIIAYPRLTTDTEKTLLTHLKKIASRLNLGGSVFWIDGEKKVSNLYGASDLIVSLSEQENFPLVMLEAMASKIIYTATGVGGVKEILSRVDPRLVLSSRTPSVLADSILKIFALPPKEKIRFLNRGHFLAKKSQWKDVARRIYIQL